MSFVCFNGDFIPSHTPLFTIQNRGFKYGDGLFETIKVWNEKLPLIEYHFDRLFFGLKLLHIQFDHLTKEELLRFVQDTCSYNGCQKNARVRLAVYRDENNKAAFVIEAVPLDLQVNVLNKEGWVLDIFPFGRKSTDAFSNLKSANFLVYVLADLYRQEKALDECLVLNTENHICDGSKTNIFLVKNGSVLTPALHQGCVNGVQRRWIIDELKKAGIPVHQNEVSESLLLEADEIFLTNAVQGIRWVKQFRHKAYRNSFVKEFYNNQFVNQ